MAFVKILTCLALLSGCGCAARVIKTLIKIKRNPPHHGCASILERSLSNKGYWLLINLFSTNRIKRWKHFSSCSRGTLSIVSLLVRDGLEDKRGFLSLPLSSPIEGCRRHLSELLRPYSAVKPAELIQSHLTVGHFLILLLSNDQPLGQSHSVCVNTLVFHRWLA